MRDWFLLRPSSSDGARKLPDALVGRRPLGIWHSADAYAFGVILWEILTCEPPLQQGHSRRDIELMFARVQRGERPPVADADTDAAPAGYVALMRELWHHDPVVRPTFAEALRRLQTMSVV